MSRVIVVVALVLLAGIAAAAASSTAGASEATVPTPVTAPAADATAGNNSTAESLGASISSFMQTNAERADETVDHGMWQVAFERSDGNARTKLAEKRVRELQGRLENLAESRRALFEARRNGSIDRAAFVARMRALQARASAIEESVEATSTALERAAVTPPGLDGLHATARNATAGPGPGVMGGSGPPGTAGGPPTDDGTNSTGPSAAGPGGNGPPGENPAGQSDTPGAGQSQNATASGPPGVAGQPGPDAPRNRSAPDGNGPGALGPPIVTGPSGAAGPQDNRTVSTP